MKRIIMLATFASIAACSENHEKSAGVQAAEANLAAVVAKQEEARQPSSVLGLSNEDKGRTCRAIIASLNGRDPNIIRVISSEGEIYRVRYTRDDGTVWTYECGFGAGVAQWRMVENGRAGRWRTEDTIQFSSDGPKISVNTFMDGEPMTSDTFTVR